MGKIGDWINRQRHNRGYGIQSPSSFFFITQVLKERLPYYAYTILGTIAKEEAYSDRRLKELFRITNYHKPTNCIAIDSVAAACAMSTACPSTIKHCISSEQPSISTNALLTNYGCQIKEGTPLEIFRTTLEEVGEIGMLYIGNTPQRAELLETALRYTNDNSLIVIEGIHNDRTIEEWWQTVIEKQETIITYDLYSYGLLYFNKERIKQHYTLKK